MKTVNEFLEQYKDYIIKDEEALLKLLENPKPKTVWDLQKGDIYWYISSYGEIECEIWKNDKFDIARRQYGNHYLTEEEAKFALEKKKIIAEMKRLGGTEDMMSLGDEHIFKYFIIYNHKDKILSIDWYHHLQEGPNIYFATKKQAQKAINMLGEDRIKKYIFYVKE